MYVVEYELDFNACCGAPIAVVDEEKARRSSEANFCAAKNLAFNSTTKSFSVAIGGEDDSFALIFECSKFRGGLEGFSMNETEPNAVGRAHKCVVEPVDNEEFGIDKILVVEGAFSNNPLFLYKQYFLNL